jgi:hypothetical protein
MNVYRIDLGSGDGKASTRFWLDARNIVSAAVRGFLSAHWRHRRISHGKATSFSVTRETA